MSEAKRHISPMAFPGVFTDGALLFTRNQRPGERVYGERLFAQDGVEYREWVPTRSKLAAFFLKGGKSFFVQESSDVLYLGAASGTTASHVADVAVEGRVFCVEFSSRSFRDLVTVCERRRNMVPILADATRPESYSFVVDKVDVVYQDIAQKGQASIFLKNLEAFAAPRGMLVVKARSEDVTANPQHVFREVAKELKVKGYEVREVVELDPYEKDHALLVVERP